MQLPNALVQWLDYTRLSESDNAADVAAFCQKAVTPFGSVAAICAYPEFINTVKSIVNPNDINIATVVNFPSGSLPLAQTLEEIKKSIALGANEIDVVMPYSNLQAGENDFVEDYITQCKKQCGSHILLKVIIESGALKDPELIKTACELVIRAGGDFIKTSTGKVDVGATLESVKIILDAIKHSDQNVGLKISGGIRRVADAEKYVQLVSDTMGSDWLTTNHFRIGASSLLDDILKHATNTTQVI